MDEKRLEEKYELFRELEKYNLEKCLFEKFQKKNVRVHILWKLDDEDLDFVGLNRIEKREYEEAKKITVEKFFRGNSGIRSVANEIMTN